MRRVAPFLVRLYPASWRERYGEEFETLVADALPGWWTVFDVVKGAISMHMSALSFPKLAAILSVAGVVCGLAMSMVVPHYYLSTAEMQLSWGELTGPDRPSLSGQLAEMEDDALRTARLARIVQNPRLDLFKRERSRFALDREAVRINVEPEDHDRIRFSVAFLYTDAMKARYTVQALVNAFHDAYAEMRAQGEQQQERSSGEAEQLKARVAELEKRLGIASPEPNDFAAVVVIAAFRRTPQLSLFPAQTA